nr:hypothetical protein [uncultured Hyphomicrobium sp.]
MPPVALACRNAFSALFSSGSIDGSGSRVAVTPMLTVARIVLSGPHGSAVAAKDSQIFLAIDVLESIDVEHQDGSPR